MKSFGLALLCVSIGFTSYVLTDTINSSKGDSPPPNTPFSPEMEGVIYLESLSKQTEERRLSEFYSGVTERDRQRQLSRTRVKASSVGDPQSTTLVPISDETWWKLAGCETGGKYNNPNTGNGYYGYFQFSLQTWRSVGGTGFPHEHSYEVQRSFAKSLQRRSGWGQWPLCSKKLGLR